MASSLSLTVTLALFSVLLSATLPLHASANSHGGFRVELIHRDSPKSPYYNASSAHYDRIIAAYRRSTSRADYLFGASSESGPGFQSQVIPKDQEYLMSLTLGTPPVKRLLLADTGSDIVWTQCKPCTSCYRQNAPLFDPSKSSTYKKVVCQSPTCKHIDDTTCSRRDNTCQFTIEYGTGTTEGVISSETIGFESITGRGNVSVPNLVFGCSTSSEGPFPTSSSGLAGLGGGPWSLISQLRSTIGDKFAYCLVPYTNVSASSVLSFGDKAIIVKGNGAVTTPLVKRDPSTFYYITLEEITVAGGGRGGSKIVVDNINGSSAEKGINVVVDSGTLFTFLEENLVSSLVEQISKVVKLPKVELNPFGLCYDITKMKSDSDLPDITFKYTGGSVKLSPINTFVSAEEGVKCLAILRGEPWLGIIGNIAQQNFHVAYDLQARTVTFAPANCAKF